MDKKRLLSLVDQLHRYEKELVEYIPKTFNEYVKNLEKKRFTERTLQLMIETCLDCCNLLVKELKLGIPAEEENILEKLHEAEVISEDMADTLKEMKKFRNVLIHRYVQVDDAIVYENATKNSRDFSEFRKEIVAFLHEKKD